jgi:[protein-PII] uridylyltransferase
VSPSGIDLRDALRSTPGTTPMEARKCFWDQQLERLRSAHRRGEPGIVTARAITDVVDAIVLDAHHAASDGSVRHALVALGGYGRQEMSPRSDVDLLFLFPRDRDKAPDLITGVLHSLWDLGYDLGHASRTVAETVKMAREDVQSCTAMLDSRFLAGDRELFDDFQRRLLKQLPKTLPARLRRLHVERGRHTGSVQLLEPNVKESPGGLREIHLLEWGLKAHFRSTGIEGLMSQVLTEEDIGLLAKGRDFLWRIRHDLHFEVGRKHDTLEPENKPVTARHLGYADRAVLPAVSLDEGAGGHRVGTKDRTGADRGRELAVERFMGDYFLCARDIFHCARLGFDHLVIAPKRRGKRLLLEPGVVAIDNEIELPDGEDYFREDPRRFLHIFFLAQSRRLPLSEQARRVVRSSLGVFDDSLRRDPVARDIFLKILRRKQRSAETLREMHELGVLGAYLPEFGDLTCLVQYDIYHIYTADEHTLVALENLESIPRQHAGSPLRQAYEELNRKDLLFLGTMLHDVGKSRREEHIQAGIQMAQELMERLDLPEADRRQVLFLIEQHQEMVLISQRRDLDDYKMIADFAGRFAQPEWLRALYLLSYADLSAVAADAWSDWQGALLWELYHKTMQQLESGMKTLADRRHRREIMVEHLRHVENRWPPARVVAFQEHVQQLPGRYLVAYDLVRIERHLALVDQRQEHGSLALDFVEHDDHTELVVCTSDQHHLLANVCGVLAVNDVDILRADVQTRDDDIVLDTFQITDIDGSPALPEWKKERLELRLQQVLVEGLAVRELFDAYSANWSRRTKDLPTRQPMVDFENQVSDRFTVVDVEAQNAAGVLYAITRCLGDLDLDIHMAIINTVADRATDAFYFVDSQGRKILNYDTLEAIRARLTEALSD